MMSSRTDIGPVVLLKTKVENVKRIQTMDNFNQKSSLSFQFR